jgi:phospholipid/cholesterol/gamma-HCH transport system substrate-binding protein
VPTRRGAQVTARLMTIALLAVAICVVAYLLFARAGAPYKVVLSLDNASQLVKGNQVKVGGVSVGSVSKLELGQDARARIEVTIDDDSVLPLHAGTRAEVRSTSLAGVANRYVALTPGPVNSAELDSGATIPAHDTQSEVDLDQLLNTLDARTVRDIKLLTRNGASALSGRGRPLARALTALNPALSQVDALERELLHDQGRFGRFLVESADVVTAVASRRPQLERLVASGRATMDEVASRDAALDSLLRHLPGTLRQTNTTLVNLRGALVDVDPTLRVARPVARPLANTLGLLRPVMQDARPVVRSLRNTIDRRGRADLIGVLRELPSLASKAVPALDSTTATVTDLLPIVTEARPYAPDAVGGLFNGFGGSTGGYYDANGQYTRISFQSSAYSLESIASLLPIPSSTPGLTGYQKGVTARCPGSAAQAAADRSNPRAIEGCDPGQVPP